MNSCFVDLQLHALFAEMVKIKKEEMCSIHNGAKKITDHALLFHLCSTTLIFDAIVKTFDKEFIEPTLSNFTICRAT